MSFPTDETNASRENITLTRYLSELANDSISEVTLTDVLTEEVADLLNIYFTPCLIILGIIGNFLSVIVFFKSKLRTQSTSQYLSALAISDTVFLLQLVPPWLNAVQVSRVFARNYFCQTFVYFTYVSSAVSSWLVVAFTLERFVAVLYPLQRTSMCTVRRARGVIAAITLCCLGINIPVLKYAVPKADDCNINYELMEQAAKFNVVDTIFSFTLPLTVITVLNICIVLRVYRVSRARSSLQEPRRARRPPTPASPATPASLAVLQRPRTSMHRSQQRITRMLVIVSSVFVVLNMPAYAMRILAYANNVSSDDSNGNWAAIQQICLLCFYANFGINFFLYCMTGQNFRRALCQTFPFLIRVRTMMKSIGCWQFVENGPPPRPSVTNSLSVNTEASAHITPHLMIFNQNVSGINAVTCNQASDKDYLKLYRFDNTRQTRLRIQNELQPPPTSETSFPVRMLQRPVPQRPDGMRMSSTTSCFTEDYHAVCGATQTMLPIPFLPIPGQIAPLGVGSMPPTPSLNPSPSPPPIPPLIPFAEMETAIVTTTTTTITTTTASTMSTTRTVRTMSVHFGNGYYPWLFDYEAALHRNNGRIMSICSLNYTLGFPLTPRRFSLPVRESYTPEAGASPVRREPRPPSLPGSGLLCPVAGPVPCGRHLSQSEPLLATSSNQAFAPAPPAI